MKQGDKGCTGPTHHPTRPRLPWREGMLEGGRARGGQNGKPLVSLDLTLPSAKAIIGGFHIVGHSDTWSDNASNS